jgi:hypothetical protein
MADFFGFKITTSKKHKVLFDYANTTPVKIQLFLEAPIAWWHVVESLQIRHRVSCGLPRKSIKSVERSYPNIEFHSNPFLP